MKYATDNMKLKAVKVDHYKKQTEISDSLIVLNYTGINVRLIQQFREGIKGIKDTIIVAKNTLMKKALEQSTNSKEFSNLGDNLKGQNIFVFSKDIIKTLNFINGFKKQRKLTTLSITGCKAENNLLNKEDIEYLSKLNSKSDLIANLTYTMKLPLMQVKHILETIASMEK